MRYTDWSILVFPKNWNGTSWYAKSSEFVYMVGVRSKKEWAKFRSSELIQVGGCMNEEELYVGYDEDTVNEIEGITDKVTDLSYTKLEYPAILFKEDFQLPKHKILLISNMVK